MGLRWSREHSPRHCSLCSVACGTVSASAQAMSRGGEDDVVIGTAGADVLRGGRGDDRLVGRQGPDQLLAAPDRTGWKGAVGTTPCAAVRPATR